MLRKLFWLLGVVILYFWLMLSEEDFHWTEKIQNTAKMLYRKWENLELEWHIHTPACRKKKH